MPASVDLKLRTFKVDVVEVWTTPMQSAHPVPSEVQPTAGSLWKLSVLTVGRLESVQVTPASCDQYWAIVLPLFAFDEAIIC